VSEDRLLQSFCALLGAIVLVASVHVFLLATSAPRLEREPALKTASLAEAAPTAPPAAPVAPEVQAAEVAPDARAELVAHAEAETVSQQAEAALVAPAAGAELAARQAEPANATAPASIEAALPAAEEAQAAPTSDSAQELAVIAEPVPTEAETEAAALLEAAATDHAFVSEPSDPESIATTQDAEAVSAEAPIAEAPTIEQEPSSLAAAEASLEELIAETIGAREGAPVDLAAATDLNEAASPSPAAVPAFEAEPDFTGAVDALPEITVPLRKPQAPAAEPPSVKAAEAPEKIREQPERRQVAGAGGDANSDANAKKPLWKPMTLGFGKKDRKRPPEPKPAKESSAPQAAPAKAKPASSGAYRAQVWAKLARHRPRLGKPGSTTVVFAIGPSGALRSARVGRSSGNAALDQRALAAVRAASPFPSPPGAMSASALNFSIQIYFR
jgi:protein TonB